MENISASTWSSALVLEEVTMQEDARDMQTFLRKGRDSLKFLVRSVDSNHPTALVGTPDLCHHVNHIIVVLIQCWVNTHHIAQGQLVVLGVPDLRQRVRETRVCS